MNKSGYATYKNGKLYFNSEAWTIITSLAKQRHKSPTFLVVEAIKRYIRLRKGK